MIDPLGSHNKEDQSKDRWEIIPGEARESAEEIVEEVVKNKLHWEKMFFCVTLRGHGAALCRVKGDIVFLEGVTALAIERFSFASLVIPVSCCEIVDPEKQPRSQCKNKNNQHCFHEFFLE